MRNVTFDPKNAKIDVDTVKITEVPLDTNGKPFDEYMKDFFFGMIAKVIWAMGNDIDMLADMTPAFSIPGEKVKKLGWLIKPVGKFLNKLTFKRSGACAKRNAVLKRLILPILPITKLPILFLNLFRIFTAVIRLIRPIRESINLPADC